MPRIIFLTTRRLKVIAIIAFPVKPLLIKDQAAKVDLAE